MPTRKEIRREHTYVYVYYNNGLNWIQDQFFFSNYHINNDCVITKDLVNHANRVLEFLAALQCYCVPVITIVIKTE